MTHRESSVGTGRARSAHWWGLEEPRLARSFLLVLAVKEHCTETTSAATWGFASNFLEIPTPLRFSAAAAQQKLKWVSTLLLTALKTPRASRGGGSSPSRACLSNPSLNADVFQHPGWSSGHPEPGGSAQHGCGSGEPVWCIVLMAACGAEPPLPLSEMQRIIYALKVLVRQ